KNLDEKTGKNGDKDVHRSDKLGVAVLALCGSIIVGGNVAPTEEVLMIAVEVDPAHVLIMALLSILLSAIILSFIDFKGGYREKPDNFIYHLTFDTCVCYVVALAASAFVLWFFGRFE